MRASRLARPAALVALGFCVVGTAACRQDMHDQPRLEPYETSRFFADGQGSRVAPAGTVARGALREDALLHRGVTPDGQLSARLPFPLTAQVLRRGQDNFNAFCSPCHDRAGSGRGMVVRRGYKQPTSFHDPRLRDSPVGYFFDVMTNGFSTMPSYAAQIRVEDRWAITAYIRALQLSRNAHLADLNAADVAALDSAAAPVAAAPPAHATPAAPVATTEGGH
jgi:mono/diheme cytochrome c family protein